MLVFIYDNDENVSKVKLLLSDFQTLLNTCKNPSQYKIQLNFEIEIPIGDDYDHVAVPEYMILNSLESFQNDIKLYIQDDIIGNLDKTININGVYYFMEFYFYAHVNRKAKTLVINTNSSLQSEDNELYEIYLISCFNKNDKLIKHYKDIQLLSTTLLQPKTTIQSNCFVKPIMCLPLLLMASYIRIIHYQGLFEIHVTVNHDGSKESEAEFQKHCTQNKIKPILIELPDNLNKENNNFFQMMTSSRYHGDYVSAQVHAFNIANRLQANDKFQVERVKIETLASAKGVPNNTFPVHHFQINNYFEFHIKLLLPSDSNLTTLSSIIHPHKGHLSRNAFKKFHDTGIEIRFVTLRIYQSTREKALEKFSNLEKSLRDNNFIIESIAKEYSVFDTNVHLDKNWLIL